MMLCRQIRIKQMQVMKKKKKIDKAHMKKTANNMMLCRQIRTDQMQVIKRKKINKETDGVQRMDQMQVMKRKKIDKEQMVCMPIRMVRRRKNRWCAGKQEW